MTTSSSEGLLFCQTDENKIDFIEFYSFLDLENFLSYLPQESQRKIEKKVKIMSLLVPAVLPGRVHLGGCQGVSTGTFCKYTFVHCAGSYRIEPGVHTDCNLF